MLAPSSNVTAGGQDIVPHAGVVRRRVLAGRTGPTTGRRGRWPRGGCWCMPGARVVADLACTVVGGAGVIELDL